MPEQDVNQAASKFISSLVKSLQILCNGQVEFAESIELVGHINVRVDHKYKFDYIVDEQVSKEGEDSSTTFLSNSYHSSPPTKQKNRKILPSQLEQDVMFTEIPQGFHRRNVQTDSEFQLSAQSEDNRTSELSRACDENKQGYSVTVSSPRAGSSESSQVVVKLEKGDDSNDCMVLPASPDDYEATGDASGESFPDAGPSSSYEDTHGSHPGRSRKRRKPHEQGADDMSESKVLISWHRTSAGSPSTTSHKSIATSSLQPSPLPCQVMSRDNTNDSYFRCTDCLSVFDSMESLNSHTVFCQGCQNPESFQCRVCQTVFVTLEDYSKHMMRNHKYVSCSQCHTWWPSSSALRGHVHREHEPKFVCSICSKTFHCKINYKGHMNMHTGAKPYACSRCGKSFAYQQSKYAHEKLCYRIHN